MTEEVMEEITETIQADDGVDESSAFADSLKDAMSQAMGRKVEEPQEVEEEEEDAEVEKDEPKQEEEFKLIPKEWTKKEQETFQAALDNPDLKEATEAFIARYENLRKDYHRKAGERADYAKKVSVWDDVFDGRAKEALKARGIDEPEYVKRLLNVERQLITNPAETIKKLAEAYKVDLRQAVDNNDDDVIDYDKTIAEMKKEIADLKNNNKQTETDTAATEDAYIAKQVKDFEFAIDESGEPMYPLFKEVRDEMGILLQNGKAKTLEDAYEMSPTVKLAKLEETSKSQSRNDMEEEKRKVAKAKKAARGISNNKVNLKQNVKMTLEDRLREKFAEARANS